MKSGILLLITIVKVSYAFTLKKAKLNASMNKFMASNGHHEESRIIGGIALSLLVGFTNQHASAQNMNSQTITHQPQSQNSHIQKVVKSLNPIILTSIGAPSFGGGSSFETLDFSLPSYDEAVGKVSTIKSSDSPSFTATFNDPLVYTQPSVTPTATEKGETGSQKKDQEATLIDNEEKKKADLQAKRALEKQKQLEMVERNKRAIDKEKEESISTSESKPSVPIVSVPSLQPIKDDSGPTSVFKPPVTVLKEEIPSPRKDALSIPSFDIKVPELSKVQLPSVAIPSFDAPKLNLPDLKSLPSVNLPQSLERQASKTDDRTPASSVTTLENQEIRDQRAREALLVYKQKDEAAKLLDKKAAEAQMVAKEYKNAANAAKDEACKTRPGGKLLCLRPWWSLGY